MEFSQLLAESTMIKAVQMYPAAVVVSIAIGFILTIVIKLKKW